MKYSLGISDFLEITSLSHSVVSSVSLHWSLRKAFLFLLAILWNSAFKWVYLSFSPLLFASLLFTAICKASSDNHFAFLHFFFLWMVLITTSCTISRTSVHSSLDTVFQIWTLESIYHFPLAFLCEAAVDNWQTLSWWWGLVMLCWMASEANRALRTRSSLHRISPCQQYRASAGQSSTASAPFLAGVMPFCCMDFVVAGCKPVNGQRTKICLSLKKYPWLICWKVLCNCQV